MGLTKDYLKYNHAGVCNLIASSNGTVRYVDGITCAVSAAESVSFYNMRTLGKIHEIRNDGKVVTAFIFSPDRSTVAIGYNDGETHLHRRFGDGSHAVFAGHRTGVNCIAFSEDGLVLATGGKDSVIVIWNVVNESGICRLHGHKGTITHIQFVKNGKYLVSSSKDTQIRFWDMLSNTCFYTLAGSTSEIYSFTLLDDANLLVYGNAEIELQVYKLQWFGQNGDARNEEMEAKRSKIDEALTINSLEKIQQDQANSIVRCDKKGVLIRQAKGRALQIAVSSDESVICCVGADNLVDVYRYFTEEESKKRFQKKLRKLRQRAETTDEEMLVKLETEVEQDVTTVITRIGDFRADSKVKWVDMCDSYNSLNGGKMREYRFYCLLKTNDVQGIALRIDWKSNATDSVSLTGLGQLVHRSDVRTMAISSDAKFFVSASQESAIVWDMASLKPLNKFTADGLSQISTSLITPDDRKLLLGTRTGWIYTFDLKACELLQKCEAHENAIVTFSPYPDKNGFISCGQDKKCRFWNYKFDHSSQDSGITIRPKRILELPDEPLCATISANNKFLAFGLLDNTARIYFMDTLKFFVSLYGHSLPVYCVDISLDNKLIITGSADKSVKIWGLDFGDCHKSLFAHDEIVTCVKFSNNMEDDKLFWSAGKDGKIKQWDAVKFNHIQTLEGHTDQIDSIILNFDGSVLISASRDKSIRIWELSDEIIVLQEEEEMKREKEYEDKLLEEDIIPGESKEADTDLAALKSIETIKSTESIIESLEIIRKEREEKEQDPTHVPHILLRTYPSNKEYQFLADTIQKIRLSHLEKSLCALPTAYVELLLSEMCKCVKSSYKPEIASRVINFIMRINHNQMVLSMNFLPMIEELKSTMPSNINASIDRIGFNIAALKFLQRNLEERQNTKLFNVNIAESEKEAKKSKRKKKVKDFALLNPIAL